MKTPKTNEEKFMTLALAQARAARRKGEVPVGAVLVFRGRVVSRGHNQPLRTNDPTAHAEVVAIRRAARRRRNYRLSGGELFVTVEPCAMCVGAIIQARLGKVVFGAADPKAGAVRSMMRFPFEKSNHRPEVRGGVLASECGRELREFFREKRGKSRDVPSF